MSRDSDRNERMRRRLSALFSKYYVKGRNFTMKIMSEKTGKEYATVEECVAAEKAFDEAIAEKKAKEEKALAEVKAKKEKLTAERKERAVEVENAYKAILEAQKVYREKLNAFVKDYGSFHMTVRTGENNPFDFFEDFWKNFWF